MGQFSIVLYTLPLLFSVAISYADHQNEGHFNGLHTNIHDPSAESTIAHRHGHIASNFIGDTYVNEAGHSNGAELSSLAHTSAVQANNAVRNQHTQGSQAAFGIKSSLATAAIGVRLD